MIACDYKKKKYGVVRFVGPTSISCLSQDLCITLACDRLDHLVAILVSKARSEIDIFSYLRSSGRPHDTIVRCPCSTRLEISCVMPESNHF